MTNLNLAYIQADLKWEDKAANLKRFERLLEQVQPDTDLILLPYRAKRSARYLACSKVDLSLK